MNKISAIKAALNGAKIRPKETALLNIKHIFYDTFVQQFKQVNIEDEVMVCDINYFNMECDWDVIRPTVKKWLWVYADKGKYCVTKHFYSEEESSSSSALSRFEIVQKLECTEIEV